MSDDVIYVPISRKLYDDIVRFSEGRVNPAAVAEAQLRFWVEETIEFPTDDDPWGDRRYYVAEVYAPHVLQEILSERSDALHKEQGNPLVWKGVTVSAGSKVRMPYGGKHHYAKIEAGAIIDDGKAYTPSEWASKVAGGTSRNAWRDLWFQGPASITWVPAQLLREQAEDRLNDVLRPQAAAGDE